MKLSYQWLKEWVNVPLSAPDLAEQLSLSGLEVDSCMPAGDDFILDVQLTPNRGDCLSVLGVAREVGAINRIPAHTLDNIPTPSVLKLKSTKSTHDTKLPVHILAETACPRYNGRIVKNIDNHVATPAWMQQRLQSADVKCISLIVDIMNYVMLEIGQPFHAFDLQKIHNEINVRYAKEGESLTLLDNQTIKLASNTLVIADSKHALALAGVMGGLESAVTIDTTDIFIESAFFAPQEIQGRALWIETDGGYRFERGVDPTLSLIALERATELLISLGGGEPGPIIEVNSAAYNKSLVSIELSSEHLARTLGTSLPAAEVTDILQRLGMQVSSSADKWQVTVPSYRFDMHY